MKIILIIIMSIAIASCASTSEQYLTSEPVEIGIDKLDRYWVNESKSIRFSISPRVVPAPGTQGVVKVRFLIDSKGDVYNPEIIESYPEGAWDQSALVASTKQKYVPSKDNTKRTPVYVIQTIKFKFG
ncbi:energy transducer TonB [Microbulbifer sp. YPW1]|uniref:energy transducer TonB n=1 Tax=Microbulbifer sp. YPW1 TaxID=2745199 RepID=UPI00159ADF56|nr:energy transducer TonB [Microbulbifer sp. YPW1]QKX17171.1 TonB family protein [Microbulbifer sp. YPW1]